MSSSDLIRWSGLSAFAGGVLFVIADALEFLLFADQPDSVAATTNAWLIVDMFFLVAIGLILLALVGLYARQAQQAGILGRIAFLAALSGTVMMFGFIWAGAFILPAIADEAPEFMDSDPAGVLMVGVILTFALFVLGWLLFGLISLRANVLPRGAAALLIVGAILIFAYLLEVPFSTVVFGTALAWMGYALWSGTGEPALGAEGAI